MSSNPWDQLPDESPAAYARFRAYVSLGPDRSVEKAYRSHTGKGKSRKRQAPGQWQRDCWRFQWVDRAPKYDIYLLEVASLRVVSLFVEAVSEGFLMTIRGMAKVEAATSTEVIANLKELAAFVRLPDESGKQQGQEVS